TTADCVFSGARLSSQGEVLDPAPLTVGGGVYCGSPLSSPAAMPSGDGGALVAWTCSPSGACGLRVSDAGVIGPVAEINVTADRLWFSSSFDGANHLIVWGEVDYYGAMSGRHLHDLRGAVVTPAGAILGDPAGFPIAPDTTTALGLSTVFD